MRSKNVQNDSRKQFHRFRYISLKVSDDQISGTRFFQDLKFGDCFTSLFTSMINERIITGIDIADMIFGLLSPIHFFFI